MGFLGLKWPAKALVASSMVAAVLAACGGGDPFGPDERASGAGYGATLLVSDVAAPANPLGGLRTDPQLVNGWGIAIQPRAFAWVANNGTSTSTLYDGDGNFAPVIVDAATTRPTGVVFNDSPLIRVTQGGRTGRCAFLFVGEAGNLNCWAPEVNDLATSIQVVDGSAAGAVYKGLALANTITGPTLYATDFRNARVDAFNAAFIKPALLGNFNDAALPAGFAPFGIQQLGDLIYVSYARKDAQTGREVFGPGLGLINVFDVEGRLRTRLVVPGGVLNAPWGMALAPADFGIFSQALLVANAGDGKIHAFNATTGVLLGAVSRPDGSPIVIDGLHGIAFGRGLVDQGATDLPSLFFAAGPGNGSHGVYGRIDAR